MAGERGIQARSWGLRGAWLVQPFTLGPALAASLAPHSRPVQVSLSILLWTAWAGTVLGTLIAHPVSLTAIRVVIPASVAAAVLAALVGEPSPAALVVAMAAAALALSPAVGHTFVNGGAYPNERRFPLRAPGALLIGPLYVVWALVVASAPAAVALLAARAWVLGTAVVIVGLPSSLLGARALHQLSRRWLVFVPRGVVLHDHQALADPVLFPNEAIATLAPAPADTSAVDLTMRAPGLALQLDLKTEFELGRARVGRSLGDALTATAVLLTPTRAAAVMAEAADRNLVKLRGPRT